MTHTDPPVGRSWPPHDYEVGREKIREYAAAITADSAIHRDHGAARKLGFTAVVAPPTFSAVYVAGAVAEVMFDPVVGIFDPKVGLAGYRFVQRIQEFEWVVPVCSGDRLTTTATLLDAGERDGAQFRVFGSETARFDGAVVCRGRYEGVVRGAPRQRGSTAARKDLESPSAKAAKPGGALAVGEILPSLAITPDRHTPVRYAGASGDFTPFHLDGDFARAIGLPGMILHGLYTYAQLARALVEPFGGDPRVLRRLSARFRRPAVPEVELVTRAEVIAIADGDATFECSMEQGGKPVLDRGEALLVNVCRQSDIDHRIS